MHWIVGTAGHIDHGKTALVRALTGVDTDRLKEEKARGISIDLGFAALELPGGVTAGVVDVPGHERFIRNMLAGAHGIDLALFVVAADDGVMPQTEEHLEILHLLGVPAGVVVITKADLVDEARIAEVREEIEILASGTVLEGAPDCVVSSVTGRGLDELRVLVASRLEATRALRSGRRFRLPVDRAFLMKGHGVVVTGTATGGRVSVGDAVRVLPGGEEARVRSVQVHGREVATAERGQRVALNLVGVERTQVVRGHVVCDPAITGTSSRLDARVEIRPLAKKPVASRRRVRLYVGTAEVLAKMVLLGGRSEIAPRESAYAQLVLEEPVLALRGDRFILRSESAERTLGGGRVVHPFAPPHRARDAAVPAALERIESSDPAAATLALLEIDREFARPLDWIAQALDVEESALPKGSPQAEIVPLPAEGSVEALTTRAKWTHWLEALIEALRAHHRDHPLLPGMEMELLRTQLAAKKTPGSLFEVAPKLFRAIVDRLARERRLVRDDSIVRLPEHRVRLEGETRSATEGLERALEKAAYTPPEVRQLAAELKLPPARVNELLQTLARDGRAAKVANDLYYHASVLERLREMIAERIRTQGPLGAADFRDMIGATRKYSIPLLEYFDRTGFTIRVGDQRKLRKG